MQQDTRLMVLEKTEPDHALVEHRPLCWLVYLYLTERAYTKTWDGRESALLSWMRNPRVASVSRMTSVAQGDPIGNIVGLLSRLPLITGQRG